VEEGGMLDKSARVGLISAAGLAVVVVGVLFVVMRKKADERQAEQAYEQGAKDLHAQLLAFDLSDEAQAKSLIDAANADKESWQEHPLARDIQSLLARAATSLETSKERRESVGLFTEVEKKLEGAADLSPEELNDLRRSLTELEAKITAIGDEYLARFSRARTAADKAYATGLLQAAQESAAQGSANLRPALLLSQTAEEETRKLLDRAFVDKNTELQAFYEQQYKQAIAESDRIATALFTAEHSEALPWTDCLKGEQASFWNASTAKGFAHRVENGVLQIVGPDADAGRIAIISIGDREQWRNFVLDMEFTLEQGNVEMFFRLGRSPNANTISYAMNGAGDAANLKIGKTYRVTVRLLGSQFVVRFADEDIDTPPPREEQVSWAMGRKGAIGFLVPPETRLRVTSFKVRELR
jgi:hypothetical protein